jgi:hypothetical protein
MKRPCEAGPTGIYTGRFQTIDTDLFRLHRRTEQTSVTSVLTANHRRLSSALYPHRRDTGPCDDSLPLWQKDQEEENVRQALRATPRAKRKVCQHLILHYPGKVPNPRPKPARTPKRRRTGRTVRGPLCIMLLRYPTTIAWTPRHPI